MVERERMKEHRRIVERNNEANKDMLQREKGVTRINIKDNDRQRTDIIGKTLLSLCLGRFILTLHQNDHLHSWTGAAQSRPPHQYPLSGCYWTN